VGAAAADINGQIVAIIRTEDGSVHAVDDTCSHANVSLSEGELDGCTIECWLHGSRFDILTGQPSGPPATTPINVYPVKIEGDEVFVATTPQNPEK
jgi:3-phenylpropionate/trans-cinnamate dioxygenase ferredoxin subunit